MKKSFLVNESFFVRLSTTSFKLHDGDIINVDGSNNREYIYQVEIKNSGYIVNLPINLNQYVSMGGTIYALTIKDIEKRGSIYDITIQRKREDILNTLI